MYLVGEFDKTRENRKRKNADMYYCDFCGYSNSTGKRGLKKTGAIRYEPEYKQYGEEAICKACVQTLRTWG